MSLPRAIATASRLWLIAVAGPFAATLAGLPASAGDEAVRVERCLEPRLEDRVGSPILLATYLMTLTADERGWLHCPDTYNPRRAQRLLEAAYRDEALNYHVGAGLGHIAWKGLTGPPDLALADRYYYRAVVRAAQIATGCGDLFSDCESTAFVEAVFRDVTSTFELVTGKRPAHIKDYAIWLDRVRRRTPEAILAEARRFQEGRQRPKDLYIAAILSNFAAISFFTADALVTVADGLRSGMYRPYLKGEPWWRYLGAARQGHGRAARILAERAQRARNVPLAAERAYYFYRLAVRNGVPVPQDKLANLRARISPAGRARVRWFLQREDTVYPIDNDPSVWRHYAEYAPEHIEMPMFAEVQ